MGLVVAQPLSVLPVAVSPDPVMPGSQGATTTDTAVPDSFAALLAMLAQGDLTVCVPGKVSGDIASALPSRTTAPAKPGGDATASDDATLAASLAAAMLLLQLPAQPAAETSATPAPAGGGDARPVVAG
ncbi:MAG TPA: hypothetical protein VIK11_12755, partial [Tepidiformaceae bacterium]